ncbi:hypothetical protein LOD99_7555 [Oopsacas minuta]|uniref:Uncharacterized protein n=1 Tax=Oopsacas minuta TaxID=111878 RepID=A0AAV7JNX4_9METZ|nr:hypothetical protein LOD99_7555 [Oopsacas minuta]
MLVGMPVVIDDRIIEFLLKGLFHFTSLFASQHAVSAAAASSGRNSHKPFWPTCSRLVRVFLSAFDAVWTIQGASRLLGFPVCKCLIKSKMQLSITQYVLLAINLSIIIITTYGTEELKSVFYEMIEYPDHEVLENTEKEIKQIQFSKYNENVFHDSGEGIKEENWDRIVKNMGKFYKIPEDGIEQLKDASLMDEAEKNFHNFEIGGKGPGEFGYMRIAVEKKEGNLNYILAGTQIKFNLAPYSDEKKTTVDLYFMKFEMVDQEAVIPNKLRKI